MRTTIPGLSPKANIIPTTSATKSAPSRNMTSVIRAVSPASLMNRECATAGSAGDQAVIAEHLPDLFDAGIARRQDQVGLVEAVQRVVRAVGAHAGKEPGQRGPEHLLVSGLDG